MNLLVINADDLGYSKERDVGIFECFSDSRSISDSSVLANGATAKAALVRAKEIGMPVGLHFNITEGKALCEPELLPTLTESGYFLGRLPFMDRLKAGKIDTREIEAELLEQIEWFESNAGSIPHHIDGHQHVHVMPQVCKAFAKVLQQKEIAWTRLPQEICNISQCSEPLRYVLSYCEAAAKIFSTYGLLFSKSFVGISVMGRKMTMERMKEALELNLKNKSPNHTCELMVHPGYICNGVGGCGSGPDDFSMSEEREHEMNFLRNQEWKELVEDFGFTVCSFKELTHQH